MAPSSWTGSYQHKKVIKTAPDAVVLINGSPLVTICPRCASFGGGKLNISNYITSISTGLSINTTVGTASFDISMPRHGHNGKYMVRGGRVFGINLMDEVEIYIKGRFPTDDGSRGGTYKYHKVFWGMITTINEQYSSGAQNISVSCESMMKWFQLMRTNEQPAAMALTDRSLDMQWQQSLVAGKSYSGMNVYEIIYSLVTITLANLVIPDGFQTEAIKDNTDQTVPITVVSPTDIDLLSAWTNRFSKIKSSLRLFGTSPDSFDPNSPEVKSKETRQALEGRLKGFVDPITPIAINYNSAALMDFKPFNDLDKGKATDTLHNNYRSNLDIIGEVKLFTGYEFYMDSTGEFIFKPPFWNLDPRENPVYYLKDEDIISMQVQESEQELLTRVEVNGPITPARGIDGVKVMGVFTNYALARQFGLRTQQINMRWLADVDQCFYHAISELERNNSNRFKGNFTIIGRPELKLGIPIYIESRDCFVYIEHVSHNFSFGGTFTTSVEFTAMRRKYVGNNPLASTFDIPSNNSVSKLKGQPVILVQKTDQDFISRLQDLKTQTKTKSYDTASSLTKASPSNQDISQKLSTSTAGAKKVSEDAEKEASLPKWLRTNRGGTYTELNLNSSEAQNILKEAFDAKSSNNPNAYFDFLKKAIPVSDEEGYELIGIFENGRFVYLDRNNVLRKKANDFKSLIERVNSKNSKVNQVTKMYNTNDGVMTPQQAPAEELKTLDQMSVSLPEEVENFVNYKALSLAELSPALDSVVPGCQCSDPGLHSASSKELNQKKTYSKLITNVNNKVT